MKITYQEIFENNKKWVAETVANDPTYFEELAKGQTPPILWIGCSDSRVPANQITGTKPGEVFVHRNIANMVIHTDMNMLSVLDYSVNVLKVQHVIVCGHYGCGGVLAAMGNMQVGLIDNWLRHIKDVYSLHSVELDAIENEKERGRRMVQLNVIEQVKDLAKTSIVQNAWARGQELQLHGVVYDLENGLLEDLKMNLTGTERLDEVYRLSVTSK
jgi:carbonic anhydrase